MATSKSYSRLQISDSQDLTIPQTASLFVRGGSVFQKGVILGDTDTLIPGGMRFRSNQLQVRSLDEWTTHLGFDNSYDPSRVNEIAIVSRDGQALQLSGVRIFDQGIFDLNMVQTSFLESKPDERLSLGSNGYVWRLPDKPGAPRQVLTTNGRGDLYWSNNASTNEVTFTSTWKPHKLLASSSDSGVLKVTPFEINPSGGLSGLKSIHIQDFSVQKHNHTLHLSSLESDLSLFTPNDIYIQGATWPKEIPRPFAVLRCSAKAGSLEYFDLFSPSPSSWKANVLPRYSKKTGQLEATAVSIQKEEDQTTLVAPCIQAKKITDGKMTIEDGSLQTDGKIEATELTDGKLMISSGCISNLNQLEVLGATKTNTLSVNGNMSGANLRLSGLLASKSLHVGNEEKSIQLLGAKVPKKSSSPGKTGDLTWDEHYIYLHVGTRWKRVPLEDW